MLRRALGVFLVPLLVGACADSPSQPQSSRTNLDPMLAGGPVTLYLEAEFDWELNEWLPGAITGDITGWSTVTPLGPGAPGEFYTGEAYHFSEAWEIRDDQGNLLLAGYDTGVISPNSWVGEASCDNVVARGQITAAADEWSHLIGHVVTMTGCITWGPPTIVNAIWRIT
jgi:hypothetical protein